MAKCNQCGTALPPPDTQCGRCELQRHEAAAIAAFLDDDDDDDGPAASEPPPRRARRPSVASALDVLDPVARETAQEGLSIALRPRFELHSAPADGAPVVHLLLDVEPTGAPLVDPEGGPVGHVLLALDVSASMNAPDRYPVLMRAIESMLADLRASEAGDVLVSVVVFAYGAQTLLRAQPVSRLAPQEVLRRIEGCPLRFGRYSDLNGALQRAGRVAYDAHRAQPRVPLRMYVLTDGRPQDMESALATMKLVRRLPVDVHGLAFGEGADVGSLRQIVGGGRGGTVKHVTSGALEGVFQGIAAAVRRVVAKRALLDVELRPDVVGGHAYRFRPGRFAFGPAAFAAGTRFSTDLGTLESGRTYSLVFQLRLPATETAETEVGRVTLRVPGEGGPVTFEALLAIPRHAGPDAPRPDPLVIEARRIVEAEDGADGSAQLDALRARRRIYAAEHRSPQLLAILDRAIAELERGGTLESLSRAERAALESHTRTIHARS